MRPCVFVIGTRAQLVKVAPILQSASRIGLPHTVWLSGQHQESMKDLFADFEISSEMQGVGEGGERATIASLFAWLPRASLACFRYVRKCGLQRTGCPLVIVHGDTLSTLVSAYAGKWAGGEVVHLESGLTSDRLFDPFPEEMLRRLTFRVTDYAVCPNDAAVRRMNRYDCKEVLDTRENTILDSVRYALKKRARNSPHNESYFVASIHRVSNIYKKAVLRQILDELVSISRLGEVRFVLHPATKKRLLKTGLWNVLQSAPMIRLEPRMAYSRFLSLIAGARGVFSDGGSNQEELSYLGVPTVLFRSRSERPDGLYKNVILRDSIHDLYEYVESGALDKLRSGQHVDQGWQPSLAAAEALWRWANVN